MGKFTDVLKNEFQNSIKNFYVGRIYDPNMKEPPKSINDLEVMEENDLCYFDFLDNLPRENYLEVSMVVWKFIFNYEIENDLLRKKNIHIKQSRGKNDPKDIIPSDLRKAKKFKDLITKVFKTNTIGTNIMGYTLNHNNKHRINNLTYSDTKSVYDTKDYNIDDLFGIVDLIINDLENKEFKFIGKNIYYERKEHPNQEFKEYLREICKKYKITNYENHIRNLFLEEDIENKNIVGIFSKHQ